MFEHALSVMATWIRQKFGFWIASIFIIVWKITSTALAKLTQIIVTIVVVMLMYVVFQDFTSVLINFSKTSFDSIVNGLESSFSWNRWLRGGVLWLKTKSGADMMMTLIISGSISVFWVALKQISAARASRKRYREHLKQQAALAAQAQAAPQK